MTAASTIDSSVRPYSLYPPGHEATPTNKTWQKAMMVAFAIGFCALIIGLLLLATPLKTPALIVIITGATVAIIAEVFRKTLQSVNEFLCHAAGRGSLCCTRILFWFGANPNCHAAGLLTRDLVELASREVSATDPKKASVYSQILALFDAHK